jgi:cytochrome o ubiquinol oxidase subunit IV
MRLPRGRAVTSGPDNTNHALALAFGVLIVFLVVAGALWIMADLNANLMPAMEHTNMPDAPLKPHAAGHR